ncbi:MAG TPA: type II secretion system protein [Verrucomicrobiae bacterium]|nr:type II secretion system protein [Verrucomicrobiae bacterium]
MKPVPQRQKAFTLVELLIVIAVIGILAGLIFPVAGVVKKKRILAVAKAELAEVQTAIEEYKNHVGYYPPDNPPDPIMTPLYFELAGTTNTDTGAAGSTVSFVTLDGSTIIDLPQMKLLFGVNGSGDPKITGFANSSRAGRETDDKAAPRNFIASLKVNKIGRMYTGITNLNVVLVCSAGWHAPDKSEILRTSGAPPIALDPGLNPWRYVSTNPQHNPHSYDLWVDVVIGNTTNRVSNWSDQPEVVFAP